MDFSVVIPLRDEAESLPKLWDELCTVMDGLGGSWEAVFINDGSTDGSAAFLSDLRRRDKRAQVIQFRKNEGKAAGLQAGFRAAKGKFVITMDADLQDDPAEVPNLLAKLNEGYDLVSGYKKDRHDPFHKTIPSRVFNGMVRRLSGLKLHDINCGLKIYRREVVEELFLYGDLYRFIPIIAHNQGFRVGEIDVNHRPRLYGKSKYGFGRFMRGLLDLFTVTFLHRFVRRPLHLFGTLGLLLVAIGVLISSYLSVLHALGKPISDRPLLTLGVLCIISGVQLISTGLIGELITYYAHNLRRNAPRHVTLPSDDGQTPGDEA
ncbi:MAG TPA: glycosyltransferase family 2 protein [Candidatus Acidoferrum sp.]|nr:glycosyltransferase family 2 protein [Candidatus Acidoferrum sp.]